MASKEVKVERKGSYQGVPQWGITGASEMTPSKASAEKWARLENARRHNRANQTWSEDVTEEMVPENHGPFGDYYVSLAKRERSQQLRNALAVLNGAESEDEFELRQRG